MITINGQKLRTTKPSDLDAQLLASTGHGAHEIDRLLGGGPALAAAAARPFIANDDLPGGELAAAIAADRDAYAAIRSLYGDVPEPATSGDANSGGAA